MVKIACLLVLIVCSGCCTVAQREPCTVATSEVHETTRDSITILTPGNSDPTTLNLFSDSTLEVKSERPLLDDVSPVPTESSARIFKLADKILNDQPRIRVFSSSDKGFGDYVMQIHRGKKLMILYVSVKATADPAPDEVRELCKLMYGLGKF